MERVSSRAKKSGAALALIAMLICVPATGLYADPAPGDADAAGRLGPPIGMTADSSARIGPPIGMTADSAARIAPPIGMAAASKPESPSALAVFWAWLMGRLGPPIG